MHALDHTVLARRLLPSLLDAGAALLRHRAAGFEVERKADRTPVTVADREAEAIVLAGLKSVAPDVPVIAEEEVSAGNIPDFTNRAFLVDALDGTRDFVEGRDDFTVNIGLIEDGRPIFGLLLAPVHGRVFATFGPDHAVTARIAPERLAGAGRAQAALDLAFTPISTSAPDVEAVRVLTSRSHLSSATIDYLRQFRIATQLGIGSSLKFGMIAAGEADIYVRYGPTSEWDTAAGHAILRAAGGEVTRVDGSPLRYLTRREPSAASFLNPPFVAWGRKALIPGDGKDDRSTG